MAFSDRVCPGVWVVESVVDQPNGDLAPYTRRTVWTATRTGPRTVTVELTANHRLFNGAASGYGTAPDMVPDEHVDEARSAIYSFYAHDDVDVDFGPFALARDVVLRGHGARLPLTPYHRIN